MIRWLKNGRWTRPAAFLLAGILILSCDMLASASGTPGGPGNLSQQEQALDGGEGIVGTEDWPLLPVACPDPAHAYTALLKYHHYATYVNAANQRFSIDITGEQRIKIVDTDSPEIYGDVTGVGNLDDDETLTVKMAVDNVGDCPPGSATMTAKAKVTGTCSKGVLTLNITEWTEELGKVTMTCENAEPEFPFFMMKNTTIWGMSIGLVVNNSLNQFSERDDAWFGGKLNLGYQISLLDYGD